MRMNNKQKMFDNKQRFSLRKLTVGLSSVLLGLTFMTATNTNHVQAAEQAGTTQDANTQDHNVHNAQALGNSKDTTNDDVIKPVDSNSGISNTREQLTSQEIPVNKNSLSPITNSESKAVANASATTMATGSNPKTDSSLNKVGEVQSQNSTKVKVRSKRAVTPAPSASSGSQLEDVINPSDPRKGDDVKQVKTSTETYVIHWVYADDDPYADKGLAGQNVRDTANIVYQNYEVYADFKSSGGIVSSYKDEDGSIIDVTNDPDTHISLGTGSVLIQNDLANEGVIADPIISGGAENPIYTNGIIKNIPADPVTKNGKTYVARKGTIGDKDGSSSHPLVIDKSNKFSTEDSNYTNPTSGENNVNNIYIYYYRDLSQETFDTKIKYTASQPTVSAKTVTEDTQNETIDITYNTNEQSTTITYVDDDGNGQTVGSPVTITGKTGQTVATNITAPENYILTPSQDELPKQITFTDKAVDPIIVHLKHKTEQREVTKKFKQGAEFTLSGAAGAILSTDPNSYLHITSQDVFIKGTQKYDLVTSDFIGDATWDYSHIYQGEGDDDKKPTEVKDLDAISSLGDLNKTYINMRSIYTNTLQDKDLAKISEDLKKQSEDLEKLTDHVYIDDSISTQPWLKDGLHADGYYLSEKSSLVFDGKSQSWLNLKEYQEKVDPNFTWTTNDSVAMLGDHAIDHINSEKLTAGLLGGMENNLPDGNGRYMILNYIPYTYKHHSAQRIINVHLPNGEVKTITQKADAKQPVFTVYTLQDYRNGKLASQEIGNWTSGEWAEYDAPVVAGYTAGQPTVSAKTVTGDTHSETIDITYTANNEEITYKFVDDDNKGSQVGDIISVNGATDTKLTADQLPAGLKTVPERYVLAEGQSLPTEIDFKAYNSQMPRVIHLKHATKDIDKDHIPSGAHDKDNHSVTDKDFTKVITRTITINKPSGNVTVNADGAQHVASTLEDKSQTITLTRQGTYDEVTGVVTWKAWQAGHFDAVAVPVFNGYKPSQSTIDAVENVGANYTDPKINVTYTANIARQRIHYVDENGNDVKDVIVTGVTDETVNIPAPEGWNVVESSDSTTKLTDPDKDGNVAEKTIKIKRVMGAENKDNNTSSVTSSDNQANIPSTPAVDNIPKSDNTQKQTPEQKPIVNIEKTPVNKNVKKHAKKLVKKTAKTTKNAPNVAIAPLVPAERQAPVSNAKANDVISTVATVKVPDTKSGEKTLPQTGSKNDASLVALGLAMIALPGFAGLLGSKKKRDEY